MLRYGMAKIYGDNKAAEEIRNKGKIISKVLGSGRLMRTDKPYPFYTIEGKYETVRYGTLNKFIAYIPSSATLIYSYERTELFDNSSTSIYKCSNSVYAEYYTGNAENPAEFIIYLYLYES